MLLDENYAKLVKRYPPLTFANGEVYDPLLNLDNTHASADNVTRLIKKVTDQQSYSRVPCVVDAIFPEIITTHIEDSQDMYTLPEPLSINQADILKAHSTSHIYNQLGIRVNDWSFCNNHFIMHTSRTTYFNSLVTNRAMDFRWKTGLTTREYYQYGPFIPTLADSPLSNHLGFNGIVVTVDGFVPFVKRSKAVSIGKNTVATSVGASLKCKYALNKEKKLTYEGIKYAMLQELKDELKITKAEIVGASNKINIVAAYRDLVEGGKPQFAVLFKTKLTKAEVACRFTKSISQQGHKRAKWDTQALTTEDGTDIIWLSVNELKSSAFSHDWLVTTHHELHMMPSAIATTTLVLQHLVTSGDF